MTRSNAREVAVHMIYELGFGSRSAEELLEHEMTRERFAQLGEEEPGQSLPIPPPSRKRRRRKRRGRRSRRNDHAGSGTGYQQLYHLRSRL